MVERNVDGAVTIFNVEDHGVAAALMPAAHQFHAAGATRTGAREINGADFTVFRKWPAFFHDRLRLDSRDEHSLVFSERSLATIRLADGRLQFRCRHE